MEDVLVQVNELIFPIDFYILDIGNVDVFVKQLIILGRPFIKTAKTKINVFNSIISIDFNGDVGNSKINDDEIHSDKMFLLILWIPVVLYLRIIVSCLTILCKKNLDRKLGVDTSKELEKSKLEEEKDLVAIK